MACRTCSLVLKRAFSTGSTGYEVKVEAKSYKNDVFNLTFQPESSLNSPSFIVKLFEVISLSFIWGLPCLLPLEN